MVWFWFWFWFGIGELGCGSAPLPSLSPKTVFIFILFLGTRRCVRVDIPPPGGFSLRRDGSIRPSSLRSCPLPRARALSLCPSRFVSVSLVPSVPTVHRHHPIPRRLRGSSGRISDPPRAPPRYYDTVSFSLSLYPFVCLFACFFDSSQMWIFLKRRRVAVAGGERQTVVTGPLYCGLFSR